MDEPSRVYRRKSCSSNNNNNNNNNYYYYYYYYYYKRKGGDDTAVRVHKPTSHFRTRRLIPLVITAPGGKGLTIVANIGIISR